MRISRLLVDGYRHFENQEVLLEQDTTVLAGANNSGKTSLIDLLRVVLQSGKDLSDEDFSASRRLDWSTGVIQAIFDGKESFLATLAEDRLVVEAPRIEVQIEVSYDAKTDDIREYADFLMDLDLRKSAFYFEYKFAPKPDKLRASVELLYDSFVAIIAQECWRGVADIDTTSRALHRMQSDLCKSLIEACDVEVFYADGAFENCVPMERKRFSRLFNLKIIKASRPLDDTIDDKTGALSQRFVASMKGNDEWQGVLDSIPEHVLAAIESTGVGALTTKTALESLNEVVNSISATNGQAKNDLYLDFQVSEADAINVIARAMRARYRGVGVPLGERSQGLGYSNLIVLHLEIEAFLQSTLRPENALLVNVVIIEEPESHMHPQMQNAFIMHLFQKVATSKNLQALVTTHSSEIVRSSGIELLRVLKVVERASKIIDLRDFHAKQVATKSPEMQRLFSLLYSINFADVLFADKVVIYEGDTERMYFQALIQGLDHLAVLRTQYVSYVQVGGAHAHVYLPLIVDTLGIKTVVVTDVDYKKGCILASKEEISALGTTNATLTELFAKSTAGTGSEKKKVPPTLGDLYSFKNAAIGVASLEDWPLLAVAYQSGAEGYARTLEEAILAKLTKMDVWETKGRQWWLDYRKASCLDFSIPQSTTDISIRDIVQSTSGKKTDFMYSLILNEAVLSEAPTYVTGSLRWLST